MKKNICIAGVVGFLLGVVASYFYLYIYSHVEDEFSDGTIVRIEEGNNTVVDASVKDRICVGVMNEDNTDTCGNDWNENGVPGPRTGTIE